MVLLSGPTFTVLELHTPASGAGLAADRRGGLPGAIRADDHAQLLYRIQVDESTALKPSKETVRSSIARR